MDSLPDSVERDLYDRAGELVRSISSACDYSQECNNIVDLVNEFGAMAASRAHLHRVIF